MPKGSIQLSDSWLNVIGDEFDADYMTALKDFLKAEKKAKQTIYPSGSRIFKALNATPFDQVKVVIIGQDPYHGPGQAMGLCFSVPEGVEIPPSLKNIYKEISDDLDCDMPDHGNLTAWADQGVLLLNAVLTVRAGQAGSHQGMGWEKFTDAVIRALNTGRDHVVFMLWGRYAQEKGKIIDRDKHLVLTAPHPSPLAAYRGFFGCGHFSAANNYLGDHGRDPIDWCDL
jgi:uracil-DNA glycosylase